MRLDASEIEVSSMDGLRQKTPAELKEALKTLRDHQVQLRIQRVLGLLEDTTTAAKTRKHIARVLTLLREKQVQQFLLTDDDVRRLIDAGLLKLSAGKNDPKSVVALDDLAGNDARSHTLVMRAWAQMRRSSDFFERTRHIQTV
jgi:large subunit ribosomal protein L29